MNTVIEIDDVWKKYRLGVIGTGTLRHDFERWWHRIRGKPDPHAKIGEEGRSERIENREQITDKADFVGLADDEIWALRGVSFQVKQGEILGIIGRNGAGKSTLLKILSRVTSPTKGEARVKGRIASLLEVGTGFHPELTGRENIFLNGAILGMTKSEIRRKLDEIVDFAGVETYIDTPVKRYSSGMHVRLAFAVAAHLEPEILIIDEVLAVGDAEFQKKCLGKMQEVSQGGRTILFVSHNMQAIRGLCDSGLILDNGKIKFQGAADTAVTEYLSANVAQRCEVSWPAHSAPGREGLRLLRVAVFGQTEESGAVLSTRDDVHVSMDFTAPEQVPGGLCVGFDLMTGDGTTVLRSYHTDAERADWPAIQPGFNRLICSIPAGLLNGGVFQVSPRISVHNVAWYVQLDSVIQFELVLDHGVSPLWHSLTDKARTGMIAPILIWRAASEVEGHASLSGVTR